MQAQKQGAEYQRAVEHLELAKACELSIEASADEGQRRREETQRRLPPEPAEGSAGVTKVTFQYGEQRVRRRFDADDTLATIRLFLSSCEELIHPEPHLHLQRTFALSNITHFPAVALSPEDDGRTLQALGLWPSAQVRVEDKKKPK